MGFVRFVSAMKMGNNCHLFYIIGNLNTSYWFYIIGNKTTRIDAYYLEHIITTIKDLVLTASLSQEMWCYTRMNRQVAPSKYMKKK